MASGAVEAAPVDLAGVEGGDRAVCVHWGKHSKERSQLLLVVGVRGGNS